MPSVKAVEAVDLYFHSGNDVPVQRANVSKDEWEAVKEYIDLLEAKEMKLMQYAEHVRTVCYDFINEGDRVWPHHLRDLAQRADRAMR